MDQPVKEGTTSEEEEGVAPFTWFGLALFVGALWALVMGLEYMDTPTFDQAALPTIVGVAIAVALFLIIGWRAPPND